MKDWNYDNEQWIALPGELKHLPLVTQHLDWSSLFFRFLTWLVLKTLFQLYIPLRVVGGDFKAIYKKHKKLIVISNHSSHLDAVAIGSAIPFSYWNDLYTTVAKDYWFKNNFLTFFSKYCLRAVPINRREKKKESVDLVLKILTSLSRAWLLMFPEGSRNQSGHVGEFKKGVSIFSQGAGVPVLFLYLDGALSLFPKGAVFPRWGRLTLHIGEVHQPMELEELREQYKEWVTQINPRSFDDKSK